MTTQVSPVNPQDLYVEEKGSGPAILLIPHAGATAATWGEMAEDLAQVGRVIAYDRRGYHRSGRAQGRSIAQAERCWHPWRAGTGQANWLDPTGGAAASAARGGELLDE